MNFLAFNLHIRVLLGTISHPLRCLPHLQISLKMFLLKAILRVLILLPHLSDYHSYVAFVIDLREPRTYREATAHPEWSKAMNEELQALAWAQTWELTTLPSSKTAVNCRLIYKLKTHVDGSIERCKARLLQRALHKNMVWLWRKLRSCCPHDHCAYGSCHCCFFSMPARPERYKDAFLNGDLQEERYMTPILAYSICPNRFVARNELSEV